MIAEPLACDCVVNHSALASSYRPANRFSNLANGIVELLDVRFICDWAEAAAS
jgi:hypothetical protein